MIFSISQVSRDRKRLLSDSVRHIPRFTITKVTVLKQQETSLAAAHVRDRDSFRTAM